jgi:hypothetical protein
MEKSSMGLWWGGDQLPKPQASSWQTHRKIEIHTSNYQMKTAMQTTDIQS